MNQAVIVLGLITLVIGFSSVVYQFTAETVGNLLDDTSCTINKINIVSTSQSSVFLNYYVSFSNIDDDTMTYRMHFLNDGEPLRFISVIDLQDRNTSLLDNPTDIIIQQHTEIQKNIASFNNFTLNDNSNYLAIVKISNTGGQIAECTKVVEI